jgi:hypothetical protein
MERSEAERRYRLRIGLCRLVLLWSDVNPTTPSWQPDLNKKDESVLFGSGSGRFRDEVPKNKVMHLSRFAIRANENGGNCRISIVSATIWSD